MALIDCPECGKRVSEKAASCPNCGCPIAQEKEQPRRPVQTVEQTGKTYKACQLLGILLIVHGGFVGCGASGADPDVAFGGAVVAFLGLMLFLAARIGAWWKFRKAKRKKP